MNDPDENLWIRRAMPKTLARISTIEGGMGAVRVNRPDGIWAICNSPMHGTDAAMMGIAIMGNPMPVSPFVRPPALSAQQITIHSGQDSATRASFWSERPAGAGYARTVAYRSLLALSLCNRLQNSEGSRRPGPFRGYNMRLAFSAPA